MSQPRQLPVARVLPTEEWDRVRDFGPFAQAGTLPDPLFAKIIVLETPDGEIVGCWEMTTLALLEGLYLREDWRGSHAAAKRLLLGMLELLDRYQIKTALTVIQDPKVMELAKTAGFTAMEGTLHHVTRKVGT